MAELNSISYFLLAALVASLPFELRSFPLLSNLQWLFLALAAASVPMLVHERKKLFHDRLVIAALVFVLTQWLAAATAPEHMSNAIKAPPGCRQGGFCSA